jgi:hypothetical protein
MKVIFSPSEKAEYARMETAAREFYVDFRSRHLTDLSRHFLKLSQKLTPLRVACSGGNYPLSSVDVDGDAEGPIKDGDEQSKCSTKKQKTIVKYSEFAFTSKFKVLLSELEQIRDKDPSCES